VFAYIMSGLRRLSRFCWLVASVAPAWAQQSDPAAALPKWLQIHAEHRVRYETLDRRYRLGEQGSDQQLPYRHRLQIGLQNESFRFYSELQDARAALTDAGSTVNLNHVGRARVQQLFVGYNRKKLFGSPAGFSIQAGRVSPDFGNRRLIARNLYRNTTNAFDGIIGSIGTEKWKIQPIVLHPLLYETSGDRLDRQYRGARLTGGYFTYLPVKRLQAEMYTLRLTDGVAARSPRRLTTAGGRLLLSAPARGGWESEWEGTWQTGSVGRLEHWAWFQHWAIGHSWAAARFRPRWSFLYDYATGDADPNDNRSGAYDTLFGARRFEYGPTGIHGLFGRSNINSPGEQFVVRPWRPVEAIILHRMMWLAQSRDRWRPNGVGDPTGAAGRYVGQMAEFRVRYRWRRFFEFDGGYVLFREGSFVQKAMGRPRGGTAHYFFVGSEWRL